MEQAELKSIDDMKDEIELQAKIFRYQCYEEKSGIGCESLASLLHVVRQDFVKAAKVYKFSCDNLKHGTSCFKYGRYPFFGQGVPKDIDEGIRYEMKGCDYKSGDACFAAAEFYMGRNERKQRDPAVAIETFKKGCVIKHGESCFALGSIYLNGVEGVNKDLQKAFQYASAACEANNMKGCHNVSLMYTKGDGVSKNQKLAAQYKKKVLDSQRQVSSPGS